jgi:hypothetical protein
MYYFDVVDERGHRHHLPLWKLPQLIAKEIEHKKGEIIEIQKAQQAAEQAKIDAAKAAQAEQLAEFDALQHPMDITQAAAGFEP